MRKFQVVVIGDAQADSEKFAFVEKLGQYLGEKGYTVITGGWSATRSGQKIDKRRSDIIINVDSFKSLIMELEKIANAYKLN